MANIQIESVLHDTELRLEKDGMRRYTQQHAWVFCSFPSGKSLAITKELDTP